MVSRTRVTDRRRRIKASTIGKNKKRARRRAATPKFPIHQEGATAKK